MILFILQVILVIAVLLLLHYLIFVWDPKYFTRMGVPGPFPWPVIGYTRQMIKKGFVQSDIDLQHYGRVIGVFEGTAPILLTRDPDMLQAITVRHFHAFTNHRSFKTEDPFLDFQLPSLKDDHWRHVRHLLVPAFSAAKLKVMTHDINECAKLLVANIEKATEEGANVNIKEYSGAFTMDVIARTAFGIEVDSKQNKDNPFVYHAQKTLNQNFFRPAVLIAFFFPALKPLMKPFDIDFFPLDSKAFFRDAVDRVVSGRMESDGHHRIDFLQLMMNAHKERQLAAESGDTAVYQTDSTWTEKGLTREEIEAQAILFFLAGYDTTASTIAFFLYCMAMNPDCQERVYAEVSKAFGDKDFIDYDTINSLDYLERCLLETLRVYPPASRVDRVCNEAITISGIPIPKGQIIGMEVYALHHDPTIWPDPDKYDPERFTKEARESHHPCQFMPFGGGPRVCLGMRLALLEAKMATASLIRQFRFSRCDQTEVPIVFNNGGLLQPKNGIVLNIVKRS